MIVEGLNSAHGDVGVDGGNSPGWHSPKTSGLTPGDVSKQPWVGVKHQSYPGADGAAATP